MSGKTRTRVMVEAQCYLCGDPYTHRVADYLVCATHAERIVAIAADNRVTLTAREIGTRRDRVKPSRRTRKGASTTKPRRLPPRPRVCNWPGGCAAVLPYTGKGRPATRCPNHLHRSTINRRKRRAAA